MNDARELILHEDRGQEQSAADVLLYRNVAYIAIHVLLDTVLSLTIASDGIVTLELPLKYPRNRSYARRRNGIVLRHQDREGFVSLEAEMPHSSEYNTC